MTRAAKWINLAVFLPSVIAIAIALNVIAQQRDYRGRFDATKTRAYSLSEQTRSMLAGLEGDWTIALVMVRANVDRATRRQIDEVLERFAQTSPRLSIVRVDPTDPRTLGEYEALLADLRNRYRELIDRYDRALDEGEAVFRELAIVGEQQSGMVRMIAQAVANSTHASDESTSGVVASLQPLLQRARSLTLLAEQADMVLEEVRKARRFDDARPIPDYDAARSILAHALDTAANDLDETAEAAGRWGTSSAIGDAAHGSLDEVRRVARSVARECREAAQRAAAALASGDSLAHLPPMELSAIGRRLAQGDAAIVLGPDRAAVIASDHLFPKSNFRQTAAGGISFDQRFRGEQLLAAAMRSLTVERMPMVVFTHAEEHSLLRPRDRDADLIGMASMLSASRFEVREWSVVQSERPKGERNQPIVFVIVPPPARQGLEPSRQERALLTMIERLLAEGESVLLSFQPSMLPRYGQPDPWARLARPLGLRVETDRVIFESLRTATDQTVTQRGAMVQRYVTGHAIGRAVDGMQTYFSLPLRIVMEDAPGVSRHVIAQVEPDASHWLEPNWSAATDSFAEPPAEQRLREAAPIVVALERERPLEAMDRGHDRRDFRGRSQRVMAVGSGGWMLSFIADRVVGLGGERVALENPGNAELMLACIAWLAGMDELIAASPAGQEVSRLRGIGDGALVTWRLVFILGLPAVSLALGGMMWWVRRR